MSKQALESLEGLFCSDSPRCLAQGLDIALFPPRVATVSLGVLGGMGALLSITGIFGMAAYSVSKRLRELGIRVALGAQRREVLRAALGRPLKLPALGSESGLLRRDGSLLGGRRSHDSRNERNARH